MEKWRKNAEKSSDFRVLIYGRRKKGDRWCGRGAHAGGRVLAKRTFLYRPSRTTWIRPGKPLSTRDQTRPGGPARQEVAYGHRQDAVPDKRFLPPIQQDGFHAPEHGGMKGRCQTFSIADGKFEPFFPIAMEKMEIETAAQAAPGEALCRVKPRFCPNLRQCSGKVSRWFFPWQSNAGSDGRTLTKDV